VSESPCYVGVDLGGTNLKLALIDGDGKLLDHRSMPTLGAEGHDAVLRRMAVGIRELAAMAPSGATVAAVGIGVPGMVDMENGVVVELPNLPGHWRQVPVGERIEAETGLPAFVINDVQAFTVAEHELGAARNAETAVCVAVGTGIGGGLVTHGRIHYGLGGAAGEVGHQIVVADGPTCSCGNRGCAEALASGPAIAAEGIRRVLQGFTTDLTRLAGDDLRAITPELIERAAASGDAVAIEVLERAGYYLGLALAGTVAVVAPDVVVIGGGVARAGGRYWQSMEATVRAHSHVTAIDRIAFKEAELGYDAGVIGAARWAAQRSSVDR
jgi:glucokinase